MKDIEIKRPIFIIGSRRSGTTIFYAKMARHPDVAIMTRTTDKVPLSLMLMRLFMTFRNDHRHSEAAHVWNKFNTGDDDSMTKEDVTPRARRYFYTALKNHLKYFKKSRFVSKCPNNSLKIEYFNEIFPDAIFIHIVRDGRAATSSLLKMQERKDYFRGVKPPGWRELYGRPSIEQCALQWKMTVEYIRESARSLPAERYIEIRYEDFMEKPVETLISVGEKCGLSWDRAYLTELVSDVQSRNYKWRENLTRSQIETINELSGDLLAQLGYKL
jgi:hypothetical protein